MEICRPYIGPQDQAHSRFLLLGNSPGHVWPTSNEKRSKIETLNCFFATSFFQFLPILAPRPASQWVWQNFFGPEGGLTIHTHHSIAKYLKNLKLMARTGTFFLRHCVKQFDITVSILNRSDAKFFCPLTYFLYNEYSKNDLLRLMVNFGPSFMEYDYDLR